jgi:hypothetical protein
VFASRLAGIHATTACQAANILFAVSVRLLGTSVHARQTSGRDGVLQRAMFATGGQACGGDRRDPFVGSRYVAACSSRKQVENTNKLLHLTASVNQTNLLAVPAVKAAASMTAVFSSDLSGQLAAAMAFCSVGHSSTVADIARRWRLSLTWKLSYRRFRKSIDANVYVCPVLFCVAKNIR